ncbi:MAG TPA: hypothetical protein VMK42_02140 [Anaeromyxobacteraceae bacterium]|nr:hypothetical protein [Anaeromyxobacteraceae bacterium]
MVLQLADEVSEAEPGFEQASLSLKRVLREGFLQQATGISIATELSLTFPTSSGLSQASAQWALIVSQRWRDLTFHLNVAPEWTNSQGFGLFSGVILEAHDEWTVRPVAEIFAFPQHGLSTLYSGLVGAIWRIRENLSLDTAFRLARWDTTNAMEVRAGVTWGFNVGFPR